MKYKTSFTDNFNKFFNNETYLPSVSLDSEWFSENSLEKIDQKAAETARGLFSNQEVQEAFSESLVCSEEALQKRVNVLTKHGFRVMSSKLLISTQDEVPFPSVIEHNDLPGMVFKTGAKRVENDEENNFLKNDIFEMARPQLYDGYLRIEFAKRIAKVCQEEGIDVVVPHKSVVTYPNSVYEGDDVKNYFLVCEKINVLSLDQTVEKIKNMDQPDQLQLARKIAKVVQKVGFIDAQFSNIRLTPDNKIAFIDTEPLGTIRVRGSSLLEYFFNTKGLSIEKSARIGLYFLKESAIHYGLYDFAKEIENEYEKLIRPNYSPSKVFFSVMSLGLVPLAYALGAFVLNIVMNIIIQNIEFYNNEREVKIKELQQKVFSKDTIEQMTVIRRMYNTKLDNLKQSLSVVAKYGYCRAMENPA